MLHKKILSLVMFLMLIFLIISPVLGGWTTNETIYDVENITADDEYGAVIGSSNQIFYNSNNSRWYMFYTYCPSSENYGLKYSYSDANDPTTWNNGGALSLGKYLRDLIQANNPVPGYAFAVTFDNTNLIGHLVYGSDYTVDYTLNYRNFSVNSGGDITLGSERIIYTAGTTSRMAVDIALTHDLKPVICAYMTNSSHTAKVWGFLADSTNGYGATWTCAYFYEGCSRVGVSVCPMGNNTALLIAHDTYSDAPLHVYEVDFTSYSNSSGSGTVFSDSNTFHDSTTDTQLFGAVALSYNTTHGCIAYTQLSSGNSYAFLFDFATLTRSTEYNTVVGSPATWDMESLGVTIEDNEFFVSNFWSYLNTDYPQVTGTEYHNASYNSYFNASTSRVIKDTLPQISGTSRSLTTTSRMTDSSGRSLIAIENDDYISIIYWTCSGEYPYVAPEVDYFGPVMDDAIDFLVPLIIVFICAFVGLELAGFIGFVAGANVGILLLYFLMNLPLYTVAIMLIVDFVIFTGGKSH